MLPKAKVGKYPEVYAVPCVRNDDCNIPESVDFHFSSMLSSYLSFLLYFLYFHYLHHL